jgi:hypothetical protein
MEKINVFPDYTQSTFWTDTNLRENDLIAKIVKHFVEIGEPFIPRKMNLGKTTKNRFVKFKLNESFEILSEATAVYDNLSFGFMSEKPFYSYLLIGRRGYDGKNKYDRRADPNVISIHMENQAFSNETTTDSFISILKWIYNFFKPYYGYSHESDDARTVYREDEWLKIYHTPQFCMAYWVNFFGPSVVENCGGKEKFLNAPAWKVEELGDGGVLIMLGPSPLNPKQYREAQNELLRYFGKEPIPTGI